jgi:hypothetical protein
MIPVKYADSGKRGINGLTITAIDCSSSPNEVPLAGVEVNADGGYLGDTISNVHCENVTSCVLIGSSSSYKTNAIAVSDVVGCPSAHSCTNVVEIDNASTTTGDVLLTNVRLNSGTTNAISDLISGNTITDAYVGFYAIGHGTNPAVLSTSPNIKTTQLTGHVGTSGADAAGTCTLTSGACPTITFANAYASTPVCTANFTSGSTLGVQAYPSTTQLKITSSATVTSAAVNYICVGNPN